MTTSVPKALFHGTIVSVRKIKAVLFVWIFNLLAALLIAVPFMVMIYIELGGSDLAVMVKPLDLTWLGDMFFKYSGGLVPGISLVLAAVAAYALFAVLLNGGFVGRLLDRDGRLTLQSFLSDCGRFFPPFLRLFAVSFIFTALTMAAAWRIIGVLAEAATANAVTEWPQIIAANLHFILALIFLAAVRMYFDYARIIIVHDNDRRVLRALRAAFTFLKGRFFRAWGLYLMVGLLFFVVTAASILLARRFSSSALLAVGLGIAAAQLFVIFSVFIKSLFITSQAEYFRGGETS